MTWGTRCFITETALFRTLQSQSCNRCTSICITESSPTGAISSATSSTAYLWHVCDMTHSCLWHDSFIRVTWPVHMCDTHMTHLCVWHESFICVTWLIYGCDMTPSYVWHDSFMGVTWGLHMCDATYVYMIWLRWVMSHIWTNESCLIYVW